MTYAYGEDNDKKRGPRWLLTHCALCGDPHRVYPHGANRMEMTKTCQCTAALQSGRRWVRDELPKREEARRQREREAAERASGPPPPVSLETKLGA